MTDAANTILETVRQNIAVIEAALAEPTADDIILAWDNGLGVVVANGTARAASARLATKFESRKVAMAHAVITNGHKERALPTRRGDILERELGNLQAMLEQLSNL